MSLTLKTPQDVMDHVDASHDEKDSLPILSKKFSDRMFKRTDCGAWGHFSRRIPFIRRTEKWRVSYIKRNSRWMIDMAECLVGDQVHIGSVPLRQVPPDVMDFFWPADLEGFDMTLDEQAREQFNVGLGTYVVLIDEVNVDRQTGPERTVVTIGTIVEGSDAECSHSLILPCTSDKFDALVESIEEFARFNDPHPNEPHDDADPYQR